MTLQLAIISEQDSEAKEQLVLGAAQLSFSHDIDVTPFILNQSLSSGRVNLPSNRRIRLPTKTKDDFLNAFTSSSYDYILAIKPSTYRLLPLITAAKQCNPSCTIITYCYDKINLPHNQNTLLIRNLCDSDEAFLSKSDAVEWLHRTHNKKATLISHFSVFPQTKIDPEDLCRRTYDVAFIGNYEYSRGEAVNALLSAGLSVFVAGSGWEKVSFATYDRLTLCSHPLDYFTYTEVLDKTLIGLCCYREINSDTTNSRVFEISASSCILVEYGRSLSPNASLLRASTLSELSRLCLYIKDLAVNRRIAKLEVLHAMKLPATTAADILLNYLLKL